MSSLGRLTLDLVADSVQLNSDLDAVKTHVLSVAKDIENAFKNALKNSIPTTSFNIPAPIVAPVKTDPWKDVKASLQSFKSDLSVFFNQLKTFNFATIPTSFKTAISNIPDIAQNVLKALPNQFANMGADAGKKLGEAIKKPIDSAKNDINSSLNAVSFGFFAEAGSKAFETITGVIDGAIDRVKDFGKDIFDVLKEVQTFDARLKTFVQDNQKRAELNKKLSDFAATTPFELKEIRDSAISNLSTMADPSKLNIEKYMGDLKALGDVAAGSQQKVGELANKFAKARSEGIAHNEDLAEWAGRGIPIYQELGKLLGANVSEVRAMASDGKINFDLLSTAVKNMSKEGGVYFNAMREQASTLSGKMSNISDTFYQFKEKLGKAFEPLANLGVDVFGKLVTSLSGTQGVMDQINAQTKQLADYFKTNPELIDTMTKSIQDLVQGSMKFLVDSVKSVVEYLQQNPDIIKQTADAFTGVASVVGEVFNTVASLVETFSSALINTISENKDLIIGIRDVIVDIVSVAVDIATVFADNILSALNENNSLVETLREIIQEVLDIWQQNKETIIEIAKIIGTILADVIRIVLGLVEGILNFLKEHPVIIQAIFKLIQLVAAVVEGILKVITQVLQGLGWIIEKTTDWAAKSKPVQDFFNSVGTAVNGIIKGMDGIIAKTMSWLKNLAPIKAMLDGIGNLGSGGDIQQDNQNDSGGDVGGASGGGGAPLLGQGYEALNQLGGDLSKNKYFDPSTPEGRGRLAIALGIGGSESFEKNTSRRNFYDLRGGTDNNMLGFGQFNLAYHADKVNTPEKYQNFFGEILAGKRALPNSQQGIGDYGVEVVKAVQSGRIKSGSDLISWMKQSKLGGSNWQGVDDGWGRNPGLADQLVKYIRGDGATQPGKGGGGSSGGGAIKTISHAPLTILDSTTGANISNYNQLSAHHEGMRGGNGVEGNRRYRPSSTRRGITEELGYGRITGKEAGELITKDFVLEKNGSVEGIPSPSPASGIVAGIIPSIGAVEIMNDQGQTVATSMHLSNIRVKKGDRVSYGQTIGTQSGVGGYPTHTHVEMSESSFKQYIQDIKSGRFGSKIADKQNRPTPQFDESNVGKTTSSPSIAASSSSGGSSISSVTSSTPVSSASSSSGGNLIKSTATGATAQAKRDLLVSRQKEQEKLYKSISSEIDFAQRNQKVEIKQKREEEDSTRETQAKEKLAKLKLAVASAETEQGKKILERDLKQAEIDQKYDKEETKLQRQREDLLVQQKNKLAILTEAKKRKDEFIAAKKAAGEDYSEADLKKFDVVPDEKSAMDFSRAIKNVDKLIESQKELKKLEYETAGVSNSIEDKKEQRAKERERAIAETRRKGQEEIDNLKKLESTTIDADVKKQLEDSIKQKDIKLKTTLELMPIDDKLEDLQTALSEVTKAGLGKDSSQSQELQKQIDELNKQKTEIARKSGLDTSIFDNERKQASVERERAKRADQERLAVQTQIANIDQKLNIARTDTERATLNAEKERLNLIQRQKEEQQPLFDKLADLQKDKETLLGSGVKESSDEMKILNDSINSVNQQLSLLKSEGAIALGTLTKGTQKSIEEAKRADASRLFDKESLMISSDLSTARLGQMQERNANPYKISAFEKEIALSQEALRYRQEMANIEEKIASFRGTNAELSAAEENMLRNNAQAVHEINLEKVNNNVRTLGKDLKDIGKGAVKDFFGQIVSGSMDFNSIMQSIISQIGNLAVELIQSHIFGEDGIFGKKSKKKDDSSGGLLDDLMGGSSRGASPVFGTMGASPMQPAFVQVVGSAGGLGSGLDSLFGKSTGDNQGKGFLDSVFGGGKVSFNKSNPLPIDMVSADKNAFSGLGDIFSGLFGGGAGGAGGGLGGILSGIMGGGATGGGGGGFLGGILGILPSIFGFAEGGKVEGLSINSIPKGNNPIAKALQTEKMLSGQKPILAVLHEGELVLNREQQERMGIFDVPRFDNGGIVGGSIINSASNKNEFNLNFSGSGEESKSNIDVHSLRAVINAEIIRQQGNGGSLGKGSYSRIGR